jgi:hypothetical protein
MWNCGEGEGEGRKERGTGVRNTEIHYVCVSKEHNETQ